MVQRVVESSVESTQGGMAGVEPVFCFTQKPSRQSVKYTTCKFHVLHLMTPIHLSVAGMDVSKYSQFFSNEL